MLPFLLLTAILLGTAGALGWRLMATRRELRELRRGLQAGESFGAEKLSILHGANATLREKNQSLHARNDELQQELAALCYSVSHDLRTPLRSVSGFSQALAEDYGPRMDAVAQDYLRRVRTGSLHLNALIDEILALTKVARAPLSPRFVDLSALAQDVVRDLSASDPLRRVEWIVQPDIQAFGDPDLLAIALRHLLDNAWKFTSKKLTSHVAFRVNRTSGGDVYEVSDNGVGFDPQYAGKLFGLFQRMHQPGEFPGNGTGLATVQRIVRRHGGSIRATAELGAGAVFSFTLNNRLDEADGSSSVLPLPAAVSTVNALDAASQKSPVV